MNFVAEVFNIFMKLIGMKKSDSFQKKRKNEKHKLMTQVLQPAYTRRLKPTVEDDEVMADEYLVAESPTQLSWYGLTDNGKVRTHNEDSFSCLDLLQGTLFVVADGMGGHDAGEVASSMAIESVCREVQKSVDRYQNPEELLKRAVQQANADVRAAGASKGSNMGTTITLAFVKNNTAYVANVGDSRVYWIQNGTISQITEDHSLVAKMQAAGKLTKEEARVHPKSNLLYRTIGTDDAVKVDTFRVELKKDGNLLLCSDGLWGEVSDDHIHQIFAASSGIKKTCANLVKTANENGGMDNITVLVASVT